MQGRGAAAVPRLDVGAQGDQLARDLRLVGGRGDVERRVARIEVMRDLDEEMRLCVRAGRAFLDARPRQGGRGRQQPQGLCGVIRDDRPYQIHER